MHVTESAKQVLFAQNIPIHFIICYLFYCVGYAISKFY